MNTHRSQLDKPEVRPRRRRRRLLAMAFCMALVAPLLATAPAAATTTATGGDARVVPTSTDRADPPTRRLRAVLRCRGGVDDGAPQVICTWRARTAGAAGFALVRVGGGERTVVSRTDDLTDRSFTDTDVEFDTRYRYRLLILDADGDRIGRSRVNRAFIRSDRPEVLSLACDGADTEPVAVRCAWDAPTIDDVASVQLWRSVAGSARELVATVDPDVTSATDELPEGTMRARYAVLGRDAAGVIVARSRAVRLS